MSTTELSRQITSALPGVAKDNYGDKHAEHVVEIYKLYLDMADRISGRRERANSFFLTLNTAITAFVGYVTLGKATLGSTPWVAIAGVVVSFLWYRIIRSYRDLNTAKFLVVHEMEKQLPIRPFHAEWEAVGRGLDRKRYLPFTHVEVLIPWIFIVLHVAVLLCVLPWEWARSTIAGVWGAGT